MKNLFDYATKELSQDAFICWLIANWDDPDIGDISIKFINYLTDFNLQKSDITDIKIKQQERNIDIVAYLYTSVGDKVLIIEDKTTSSAHSNQLKKYADELNRWNYDKENRRKVFYKANYLTDEDEQEIRKGNLGYPLIDHWRPFDINKIFNFFKDIPITNSDIFNQYRLHIISIYSDLNGINEASLKEWNYHNFQTYFRLEIASEIEKRISNFHYETWTYQGKLVSFAFYYHSETGKLNRDVYGKYKNFAYPLIEFVFRKDTNYLTINSHITFHWYDGADKNSKDKWTWKWANYKPDKNLSFRYLQNVKESIEKVVKIKTLKMGSEKCQTISVEKTPEVENLDDIKEEIIEKILLYFRAFKTAEINLE